MRFQHTNTLAAAFAGIATAFSHSALSDTRVEPMKIEIIVDGETLTATLNDSAAARDFAAQLPLEVQLKDYHGIEKVFDPPAKLSTAGAPSGYDPDVGDITFYAPWGNIAIFYKDFGYSSGLIPIGRIDGDMALLSRPGPLPARIELAGSPD